MGLQLERPPQGLNLLLSSQTVPGEGRPGKDWGKEPHCTRCGPKKAHVPSWNSKGYLTCFMKLQKFPQIPIPAREER